MENDELKNDVTLPPENNRQDDDVFTPENFVRSVKTAWEKLRADSGLFRLVKSIAFTLAFILFILLGSFYLFYIAPALKELPGVRKTVITNNEELKNTPAYKKQISQLNRDIQRLSRKYNSFTSGQSYIVINTTENRFFLYKNKKLVREGFCSSGSYTIDRKSVV